MTVKRVAVAQLHLAPTSCAGNLHTRNADSMCERRSEGVEVHRNLLRSEALAFYPRVGFQRRKRRSVSGRRIDVSSERDAQRKKPPAVLSVRFFQKSEESGFPTVPLKVNGVAIK